MKVFLLFFICLSLFAIQTDSVFRIDHRINAKSPEQTYIFTVQLPKPYYSQLVYQYPMQYTRLLVARSTFASTGVNRGIAEAYSTNNNINCLRKSKNTFVMIA